MDRLYLERRSKQVIHVGFCSKFTRRICRDKKLRGSLIIKIPNHGYSPRFGKGLKEIDLFYGCFFYITDYQIIKISLIAIWAHLFCLT